MVRRGGILTAASLRIETFERSRPEFGRAIAYWVFNRQSDTGFGNRATPALTGDTSVARILIIDRNCPAKIIHAKHPPHQRLRSNGEGASWPGAGARRSDAARSLALWRLARTYPTKEFQIVRFQIVGMKSCTSPAFRSCISARSPHIPPALQLWHPRYPVLGTNGDRFEAIPVYI